MTRDDDARVADPVARLGDGDTKDLFRRLLERGMQDLIDAELLMTCRPTATAKANRPSFTAPPISAIATLTASGRTSSLPVTAAVAFLW